MFTSTIDRSGMADWIREHPHRGAVVVCQNPRFIYLKAPRTGGTSILRRTLQPYPLRILTEKDSPRAFREWVTNVTDEELASYFVFSFVRNPWDRAVSISSYFRIPFDQFVTQFEVLTAANQNLRLHAYPLVTYTYLEERIIVDFVGRFESLQRDFNSICHQLGLKEKKLPKSSQSSHSFYGDYYSPSFVLRIAEIFCGDADSFGYAFGSDG